MKDLKVGMLQIIPIEQDGKLILKWEGECTEINSDEILTPYFNEIINNFNSSEMEIDFSTLKYMKSSTVPTLVKLITRLNKDKINTKIFYDDKSNWQTATFKALKSVVAIMTHIEVIGI